MSCQVKQIGSIENISTIRRCLFPTDDERGSDNWLQACKVSASPTADTIAIAHEKRLVVLTAKWDGAKSISTFVILFSGCIDNDDPITAILCLPVVIQSQSSQVGPEWMCIVVGFESGFIRFYTEDCKLLLSEQFHNDRVCQVKCQSQHSPRPDLNIELKPEEIYVQYTHNICSINGNQLFTLLRSSRNQLGIGYEIEGGIKGIGVKKFGFQDQFLINDVSVVGLDLANTFDHLLTASTCGGFETRYRAMAPHNTLLVGVGSKPYVAFHYALEGGSQPVLTDVAKAVASKLKSALPNWLTGNKPGTDKQTSLANQPSEMMGCRFGLCDLRRTALSITLSQDRRLAAITDMLGRVLLIDCRRGIALRIFKGYREAQCAFIQVPNEKRTKHHASTKVATFLIIYAPKKGTLEIFSAQHGLKIATFTASKFSILIYVNYGLVGFTVTTKSRYVCPFTCGLLDADGEIKEIIVPFHFSLTEENSHKARDLHLYKRLKTYIKTGNLDLENFVAEALSSCMDVKTIEVQLQCLQLLISCKEIHPEVVTKCVEYYLDRYKTFEVDEINNDMKMMKQLLYNLNAMTRFYLFISSNGDENGNQCENSDVASTSTYLGEKVLSNLQRLLDLSMATTDENSRAKVSFFEDDSFTFCTFLSAFDVSRNDQICLRHHIDDNLLFLISKAIFQQYISGNRNDYDELASQIKTCSISLNNLFNIILNYWFNRSLHIHVNLEREMENLSRLIYTLTKLESPESVEYNRTSVFWSGIREVLADSSHPFPALTAALICRGVAQKIEHERELQQSGTSVEEESMEIWEKMSQENCDWMILIGKLEDISLLNIILQFKPGVTESDLPKLRHESVDVSLRYVLQKGRGAVSELVAQWLTIAGVSPESLILNNQNQCVNDSFIYERLNILRKQFPYSLEVDVLLVNMCWEYALAWQKNLSEFSCLGAAVRCLEHISDSHLKQGLYNLVWNTHLKIIFESACKLLNKVGKLPKEKLCKQDTGLTDSQITTFINICTNFLDNFLEVVQQSYNSEKTRIKYESIWDKDNGSQPLAELALQQTYINYDLLHAHYQLSLTIQMITTFAIKHTKPVNNLYDSAVISLFFTDFQQKTQVSWHRSDTKTHASRTQFLLKIITASIESVTVNDGKIYANNHVKWMAKCQSLARVWNLDVDLLKRFQVMQLFLNGFDSVAEELLPTIAELSKLGPDLLIVAGKRLRQFVSSSPDLGEKMSALTPALTKYLDSLQNGEWSAPSSIEAISNVTTHCLRCLEENQNEYRLACQLLEACATLQEVQR